MYQAIATNTRPLFALDESNRVWRCTMDVFKPGNDPWVTCCSRSTDGSLELVVSHGRIVHHPCSWAGVRDSSTADIVVLMPALTRIKANDVDVKR